MHAVIQFLPTHSFLTNQSNESATVFTFSYTLQYCTWWTSNKRRIYENIIPRVFLCSACYCYPRPGPIIMVLVRNVNRRNTAQEHKIFCYHKTMRAPFNGATNKFRRPLPSLNRKPFLLYTLFISQLSVLGKNLFLHFLHKCFAKLEALSMLGPTGSVQFNCSVIQFSEFKKQSKFCAPQVHYSNSVISNRYEHIYNYLFVSKSCCATGSYTRNRSV